MKEKYVDVKGIRTRYLEAGKGDKNILLVHGGSGINSANDWDLNIEGLGEYFHVFAIDKLGSGFTDNPKQDEDYLMGGPVQHVIDFMKTVKISSASVAGHSRGGYTVGRLALEHPEMVDTLIICASGSLFGPHNPKYDDWDRLVSIINDPREKIKFLKAANSYGMTHINDDFVERMVKIAALPKTLEFQKKMKSLRVQFFEYLEAKEKENEEWIRAGKLKTPTLITWGFNDPTAYLDPVGLHSLRLILNVVPKSEMHIFSQAGHTHFREQPEGWVKVVTDFIKRNS